MKVLLLNPPGDRPYIRDYYCSKVSKSNYLFQPIDLVMLSGVLSERHEVVVCDAIADRMNHASCLQLVEDTAADAIVALAGSVSLEQDLEFLRQVSQRTGLLLVSGDAFLDGPADWLTDYPFLSAIVLDFTASDILDFLDGRREGLHSLAIPGVAPPRKRPRGEEFSIPIPRHELFSSPNYRFPFVRNRRFATLLTDYGCPYRCSFCVMASLGYRYRPVGNVMDELRHIKKLGKRELFFIDQSFGVRRERALDLCEQMRAEGLDFGWVCFSRVDLIDRPLLKTMKAAGCHTIIFGVESASSAILTKYQKGYTKEEIVAAFALCREEGVRTVATFILGLPEETRETARETISFLKHIQCDYASFNIAVPRAGTGLRQVAIRDGLADSSLTSMDQTGTSIAMASYHLTPEEIGKLKSEALRTFYLRPGYLLRRAASVRSWYELCEQMREGFHLLLGN